MPRCRDCKLYNLDAVKNARGSVLSSRMARCLWRSKEAYPTSVNNPRRLEGGWMGPNEVHDCRCFQKVGTP